jgi:hypothetical protein
LPIFGSQNGSFEGHSGGNDVAVAEASIGQVSRMAMAWPGTIHLKSSVMSLPHPMDQFDINHDAYVQHPDFPTLEAKARAKGFRKATASEVRASAQKHASYPELYCAYGGLWIKLGIARTAPCAD